VRARPPGLSKGLIGEVKGGVWIRSEERVIRFEGVVGCNLGAFQESGAEENGRLKFSLPFKNF
jgi:hypothetical protein